MPREKRKYIVITFKTTVAAMQMEKYCQDTGIPGRIIPVPREISAGCGLAWRITEEDYSIYVDKIDLAGVECQDRVTLML